MATIKLNLTTPIIVATLFASIILSGCVSTAKLSDFSQTSSTIDFDKLSTELKLTKTPFWTSKTSNEYYFEKEMDIDEIKLIKKNPVCFELI